mgnify:CR=1 FL=1
MLDNHPEMDPAEREKYIHIAFEKSVRLGELINEFFDITRYNLQNIELEPVEINLSMMLEQLADELYGVSRRNGFAARWKWKRTWRSMEIRISLPGCLTISCEMRWPTVMKTR